MKNKDTVQRRKPKLDKQSVYSMSFGEWLRKQLKDKRMSNAELARATGLSATYIGNLVRNHSPNTKSGVARPSEEVVAKIASALNADIDEARTAAGYAPMTLGKPRNVPELLAAIERLGVDQIMFPGGVESLQNLSEDDLNDILESVRDVIEAQLIRKTRNRV